MGKLKVLPASVANMIAAGEVVQRPASVVKELVENAVDAGASQVNVVITDAGRTMIQVIDNGCGMSPADAVLCFERHATSKISQAEDLSAILTYGFRGEALASIAAVSEVTLKTRRDGDDTATQVNVGAFGEVRTSSVAAPVGSNFCIKNLFYNTPARRKFLKSDNVEFKHIIDEFTRVAITRPEIGFSLSHNGRDIFVLKPAKSLKFRILDLLGSNVVGDVVDIETDTSIVSIRGFLGRPDTARKTVGNQFFFVNGRYFRSAYLNKAVQKGYEDFMAEGLNPSYFIFLEINPESVDVNIHPTKTEIKFEDESAVFQTLYACVRAVLGKNSFGASIDFDRSGAEELPVINKGKEQYSASSGYSPFDSFPSPETVIAPDFAFDNIAASGPSYASPSYSVHTDKSQNFGKLFEDRMLPSSKAMVFQGKYILTPADSGLMIVHMRRAMERIFYERYLNALCHDTGITQTALFPVQIQTGASAVMLFQENHDMLMNLGFDIGIVSADTIVVNGVPEGFSCEEGKVRCLVDDLVFILSDSTALLSEVLQQRLAGQFALLAVSHSSMPDSSMEAQRILDSLFSMSNSDFTPSGKKIVTVIETDQIDKLF